ncbi:MAG TPA: hypothetical protein VGM41_12110 [Chitinophagaceae bacterium]
MNSDSAYKAAVPGSGRIWGYMFGDAYYKPHSDSLIRGGSNQYSGIPKNRTAFQFRRIYLGYDYNITSKFSTELLLAAEDNFPSGNAPSATPAVGGDELLNNKLSFYIKVADIRVKNIWKGTDLLVGQISTPAFPGLSEKVWSYRSVERTIADIRRTPSYDLGAALQGTFDPATRNFGYDLMVGNGSSAKPEGDNFKWFYGDIYAYAANKKLVFDLYADYERLNWTSTWHHSRQMLKGFIAYNSSATAKTMNPGTGFTIGVEGFINNMKKDMISNKIAGGADTLDNSANGLSMYIHGDIVPNKLRFFARVDLYNPMTKIDNSKYNLYKGNTGNYNDNSWTGVAGGATTATNDETYKQTFMTAGLDFHPAKNVHFMPNVWYNGYKSQIGNNVKDHDLVFRLTFFFAFGKNYDNGGF